MNETNDEHDAMLRGDDARGGLVLAVVVALWVAAVVLSNG